MASIKRHIELIQLDKQVKALLFLSDMYPLGSYERVVYKKVINETKELIKYLKAISYNV